MTQQKRLLWLLEYLLKEEEAKLKIPSMEAEQKRLFRSLCNIRRPKAVSKEFLEVQDAYLLQENKNKQVTSVDMLEAIEPNIYLWQGDITALKADAIVNAANSALLGCFVPCHGCIDNAIHSGAGIQLRLTCHKIMQKQGTEEKTGTAKITPAYNLLCKNVIHTVGPIVHGDLTKQNCDELASCYQECLKLAKEKGLKSIAFCCISTGEFHFPNEKAAEIAIKTVRQFLKEN